MKKIILLIGLLHSIILLNAQINLTIININNVSCNGSNDGSINIDVSGGVPPYTFLWSNSSTSQNINNLQSGTYIIRVTDVNSNITIDTIVLTQPQVLSIISSNDTLICKNSQATIVSHAIGGTQPYMYFWNGTQGMSIITSTSSVDTYYNVFVIDANGCFSDTANTFIEIIPDVIIDVFTPDDSVCTGTPVNIYAIATGGNGGPYIIYNEQNEIINIPYTVTPNISQSYIFYARDNTCSFTGSDTVTINLFPMPSLMLTADQYEGYPPLVVNFNAITNCQNCSFLWNLGEQGAISFAQNPQYVYVNSGTYDVSITITTSEGCSDYFIVPQFIHTFVTGLNEFEIDLKLKIYPNPFSNELILETEIKNKNNFYSYEIFNITGQNIKSDIICNNYSRLNLKDLSIGIFFLKLNTEKGIIIKKIIKY